MGVFAGTTDVFTTYHGTVLFRDKVMGGTPGKPKLIEGWIAKNAGLATGSEENRSLVMRTLRDLGQDIPDDMTWEDLMKLTETVAKSANTCQFKHDDQGVYIESRQLKAAIKESVNILYAGERWGVTKKGPRSFSAERVFVGPDQLHLGRMVADDVHLQVGQVSGPTGTRSVLGYYEYVSKGEFNFELKVVRDMIDPTQWAEIWTHMEENGLGALKSQGYGKFDLIRWDRVDGKKKGTKKAAAE